MAVYHECSYFTSLSDGLQEIIPLYSNFINAGVLLLMKRIFIAEISLSSTLYSYLNSYYTRISVAFYLKFVPGRFNNLCEVIPIEFLYHPVQCRHLHIKVNHLCTFKCLWKGGIHRLNRMTLEVIINGGNFFDKDEFKFPETSLLPYHSTKHHLYRWGAHL